MPGPASSWVALHFVLLNVCIFAVAQSGDLETSRAFFNQVSPSGQVESPPEQPALPARLYTLLQLRNSMADFLSRPLSDFKDVGRPGAKQQQQDEEEEEDGETVVKRVFCNGFTGCGGRFRGRRRNQQPVAEIGKRLLPALLRPRPQCSPYEDCDKAEKRASEAADNILDDSVLSENSSGLDRFPLGNVAKRLFCNGYGGCQNFGKRTAGRIGGRIGERIGRRVSFGSFQQTSEEEQEEKRFFSGNYDQKMASLSGRR